MLTYLRQLLNKTIIQGLQTKDTLQAARDKAIVDAANLQRLINSNDSGWKQYTELVEDYIEACQLRKLTTSLDTADTKSIEQLKFIDHEVFILRWAMQIPQQFIADTEEMLKEAKKEEENKNEDD